MSSPSGSKSKLSSVTLAALGVVFGDIGTSPLYTIKEVFSVGEHPVPLNEVNMLGILSLIVWALIMVVSVKYVASVSYTHLDVYKRQVRDVRPQKKLL